MKIPSRAKKVRALDPDGDDWNDQRMREDLLCYFPGAYDWLLPFLIVLVIVSRCPNGMLVVVIKSDLREVFGSSESDHKLVILPGFRAQLDRSSRPHKVKTTPVPELARAASGEERPERGH